MGNTASSGHLEGQAAVFDVKGGDAEFIDILAKAILIGNRMFGFVGAGLGGDFVRPVLVVTVLHLGGPIRTSDEWDGCRRPLALPVEVG